MFIGIVLYCTEKYLIFLFLDSRYISRGSSLKVDIEGVNMKWALITGASKGIGEAIGRELSALGWRLILVARTKTLLDSLAEECSAEEGQHRVFACDLTNIKERERLFQFVEEEGIQISALVNNAGFGSNGPFIEQDRRRELRQIELNISALVDLSHLFLPHLKENQGYILNIASTAGFQPGPFMAVYYATKSFVLHFSEALSVELQGTGVSVTAHCPGATESDFGKVSGNETSLLFALRVVDRHVVAKHAVNSMLARKRVAIHGFMNWFVAKSIGFTPRPIVLFLAKTLNQPK